MYYKGFNTPDKFTNYKLDFRKVLCLAYKYFRINVLYLTYTGITRVNKLNHTNGWSINIITSYGNTRQFTLYRILIYHLWGHKTSNGTLNGTETPTCTGTPTYTRVSLTVHNRTPRTGTPRTGTPHLEPTPTPM